MVLQDFFMIQSDFFRYFCLLAPFFFRICPNIGPSISKKSERSIFESLSELDFLDFFAVQENDLHYGSENDLHYGSEKDLQLLFEKYFLLLFRKRFSLWLGK